MSETRGHCPGKLQADILIAQNDLCIYCGLEFGSLVIRKGNEWNWLEVNWDHFIPYAYCLSNRDENWVASCQLCNAYKSDFVFRNFDEVRVYITERAALNNHDPMPILLFGEMRKQDGPVIEADSEIETDLEIEADVTFIGNKKKYKKREKQEAKERKKLDKYHRV